MDKFYKSVLEQDRAAIVICDLDLRDENNKLIGYYEKHEYRDAETAEVYDFSKSLI